jgi:low temperature requirement protein LtrA
MTVGGPHPHPLSPRDHDVRTIPTKAIDAPLVRPDRESEQVERRVAGAAARPWLLRMSGRDPLEDHRASTPLELFFDLVFVVAVAQAAAELHHGIADGDIGRGVFSFLVVFLTIWWPWVNFTWFASAFDTDDVPYRLLTFVQMIGVLIVAAGVPRVFEHLDFSVAVVGYIVMRLALVAQWLRVAREVPAHRRTALRFAVGITAVQVMWAVRLAIDGPVSIVLFATLMAAELLIPAWGERAGQQTPWHPEHIAERYGLFTIIVLGECVLALMTAVQASFDASGPSLTLLAVAGGGLLILFALWWSYFKAPTPIGHHLPLRWQLAWSYGHYVTFAAIAAVGAGLQVATESVTDPAHVPPFVAAFAVAVPVAVYLSTLSVLHHPQEVLAHLPRVVPAVLGLLLAALVAPVIGVPIAVLVMGLVLAGGVGTTVFGMHRRAVAPSVE